MTSQKASASYKKVQTLIQRGSLYEACKILSSLLTSKSDPKLKDLLKQQEETYRYLIHYFIEGYSDHTRERMLSEIAATLLFINDSIRRNEILVDSSDIYSSTLRFERIRKASLQSRLKDFKDAYSLATLALEAGGDIEPVKSADDALLALFSYVWTMYGSSSEDYDLLLQSVKDENLPFELKSQIISALMLGNMAYYDRKGFSTLLDIFDADISQRVSARALVALVLIMSVHKDRITLDPGIRARLSLWSDSIILYPQLREVIMTLIRAHDTQRISSKMQNEVIPELMKLRPEILKRMGKISETYDLESLEENPEWEEIINKNGIGDKLKELTELQMDGGDVMMLAFSNLKSFPFFNSVANWFLPFTNYHNEVIRATGETSGVFNEILESEGVMCDSDKYSFIFSLSRMPEQQRQMVNSQMSAQLAQLKEAMADKKLKSTLPEFDQETTRFVRDVYRFFKLFRRHEDFIDPFATPIDFLSLPFIGEIMTDSEILNLVGEFYFKRAYYKEALPLLIKLQKSNPEDYQLWEKIGYCYNALGDLNQALEWYRKAELFNPDSQWLIKKIALCSRLLGNYKDAAEYYKKALEHNPENYHLLMNLAYALLETNRPEEALKHYYHADYVKPDKPGTWRGIAWGELLNGNKEKSLDYYKRILNQPNINASDYLNIGHVYFLLGNYKDSVAAYKQSVLLDTSDITKLEESIEEDMPVIEKSGGNPQDLKLLIEQVKYELG